MREMTFVNGAAREGLAEEMASDARVFVVGEGIGPRGELQHHPRPVRPLRGRAAERLADQRARFHRPVHRRGAHRRPARRRLHVHRLPGRHGRGSVQPDVQAAWISIGRLKMPCVVRGCVGAAQSNAAHHSGNYYPFFMHVPGFRVVMPSTPADAKGMLKSAIRSDDPVLFLEHRDVLALKGPVPDGEYLIPFGKAAVRARAAISPCSPSASPCSGAWMLPAFGQGRHLRGDRSPHAGAAGHGHDPGVGAQDGRLLVVDEDFAPCGVGAEIAPQVMEAAFDDLDAPVRASAALLCRRPTARRSTSRWCRASRASSRPARELLAE